MGWKSGAPSDGSLSLGWETAPVDAASASNSSFAGLLAALAAPTSKKTETGWSDDGLAEDVATLSYERALRTHARYKREDWPQTLGEEAEDSIAGVAAAKTGPEALNGDEADAAAPDRKLKSASITIRLSEAECAQLKRRAAEAGLTISAYLRSCTFDAEALRAQVKQALAELRTATHDGKHPPALQDARRDPHRWWRVWRRTEARRAQA